MKFGKWIAVSFALSVATACGPVEENNANGTPGGGEVIDVEENVTEDTTWEAGTYNLYADFVISAQLTLEPCTVVRPAGRVFVRDGGSIVALGNDDCPITFTSQKDTPAPGDWRYISITDTADNSNEFDHVIIEYAGETHGAIDLDAGAKFRNTLVRQTDELGLGLADANLLEFTNVSFEGIGKHPMIVNYNNVGMIDGVTTTDVQIDTIGVQGTGLTSDDTWSPQSIPYQLYGDARFEAALTVEAGTVIQINPDDRLFVEKGGSITTNGTADSPVIIESPNSTPLPGDWRHFDFKASADASTFTNTTIRHGGGASLGAITTAASITFDTVVFEDNEGCDVRGDVAYYTLADTTVIACD